MMNIRASASPRARRSGPRSGGAFHGPRDFDTKRRPPCLEGGEVNPSSEGHSDKDDRRSKFHEIPRYNVARIPFNCMGIRMRTPSVDGDGHHAAWLSFARARVPLLGIKLGFFVPTRPPTGIRTPKPKLKEGLIYSVPSHMLFA